MQLLTVVYFLDPQTQHSFHTTLESTPEAIYASTLAATYGRAVCTPYIQPPPPSPPRSDRTSLLDLATDTANLPMVIGGGVGGIVFLMLVVVGVRHVAGRWRSRSRTAQARAIPNPNPNPNPNPTPSVLMVS